MNGSILTQFENFASALQTLRSKQIYYFFAFLTLSPSRNDFKMVCIRELINHRGPF